MQFLIPNLTKELRIAMLEWASRTNSILIIGACVGFPFFFFPLKVETPPQFHPVPQKITFEKYILKKK